MLISAKRAVAVDSLVSMCDRQEGSDYEFDL